MEDEKDAVMERDEFEEDTAEAELLRDRFRVSTIAIVEVEAKKNDMEISPPIVACVPDLAFKYAEQLAKDLELFAHHAGRRTVNMEDVVLCAHRNDHLSAMLRSLKNEMKGKEPLSERKSKKSKRREDTATTSGYPAGAN